jgi:alkaline phosphatase
MKKTALLVIAFSAIVSLSFAAPAKNVIFFLTDGTGPEAWPLARWIKGSPLAVDSILTGAIRTYGADSIITDSAPGATAFATGFKGTDKGISVGAWNVNIEAAKPYVSPKYVPLATLIEGAKLAGKATGMVATSNVQHATPAAFSSHWHDRNNYNELGEQQVYQNMDVVLSGGAQYLIPKSVSGGKRDDGENLVEVLKSKGYVYATTKDELAAAKGPKVWGAFAPDAMAYDIDRDELAKTEPSIAEMTSKAVDLLASNAKAQKNGFFLFVEGSKVDWAAHSNDPAGLVSDLLAFDDAVDAALDFAKKDGDTLVVVVADHGTGGITIGYAGDPNYSQTDDDFVVVPSRKVQVSGEGIEKLLAGDSSDEKIKSVMAEKWGVVDLSDSEIKAIADTVKAKKQLQSVVGPMISKRARLGWTSGGHTGADVFLFAYGPNKPVGLMENVDVGKALAKEMGFDFKSLNDRLFVEAESAFGAAGFSVALDKTNAANPVLVVSKGAASARLPLSKNIMAVNGKTIELEGLVVLADKLGKVYLPAQAVKLAQAELK